MSKDAHSSQLLVERVSLGIAIFMVLLIDGVCSGCASLAGKHLRQTAERLDANAKRYADACEESADVVLEQCLASGGDMECEAETLEFFDACVLPVVRMAHSAKARAEALCDSYGLDCATSLEGLR